MYVRSIIYGEMIWAVDGWANCQRGISFFILRKCYIYTVLIFSMPYIPFKILYYSLQFSFLKEFFQSTELVFLFKFMQISNEASIFKWSLLVLLYCTMFQNLKKKYNSMKSRWNVNVQFFNFLRASTAIFCLWFC